MAMSTRDYDRIELAIRFLDENFKRQPSLSETARSVGLSEFHFQRLFKRWAGVTPKKFLQYLTVEHAKRRLRHGDTVLDTTYEVGLSGPGRLHDMFVAVEAVTPGEYKARGSGLTITYGVHDSPFGECLIATTDRGICGLAFVDRGQREPTLAALERDWEAATIRRGQRSTHALVADIFAPHDSRRAVLSVLLQGTNFQLKVWQALLSVPPGAVVCYEDLARDIGRPGAGRAVASAIARNPIAFIIPCHRVIRKTGAIGEYRWGGSRKKAMLGWEAARSALDDAPTPPFDTARRRDAAARTASRHRSSP
jgi:AraC family transcriptional regulator of adaptative response/methylated-DNA-[protein]-cysteine methyltransferase